MKIHHLGYAVKEIKSSLRMFLDLGFTIRQKPIKDISRKVEVVFISNEDYLLELIAPLEKGSPIDNILEKSGNSLYHICYETYDLKKSIEELRKKSFLLLQQPDKAIALDNKMVAFMYHNKYGLLELIEQ